MTVENNKITYLKQTFIEQKSIARSNEILGWEGVGDSHLLCFFKPYINWIILTANLKFSARQIFLFLSLQCFKLKIE
jgi:hypothetical protein